MAGMMIFGGTMPVFAETETQSGSDTIVWSYEDIDPELYEGEWMSFDYGFDLYLPTEWTEASDEETENIVYKLDSPDKKYPWQLPVIHQKTWEPKPNWTQ